ncbi:MAG: hypothetical protein KGK17_05990 [Betaproteobacteria bacterium]|nr:hypothetical protein [Betaproteobacteria bacterium]
MKLAGDLVPVLYLSRYIIRHKAGYHRPLRAVTSHGRWEDRVPYMLRAVFETAVWTTARTRLIRELPETTAEKIRLEATPACGREPAESVFVQLLRDRYPQGGQGRPGKAVHQPVVPATAQADGRSGVIA